MPKNKILSCINAELCYNTIKFQVEYWELKRRCYSETLHKGPVRCTGYVRAGMPIWQWASIN